MAAEVLYRTDNHHGRLTENRGAGLRLLGMKPRMPAPQWKRRKRMVN
jgi:hypothetical protein